MKLDKLFTLGAVVASLALVACGDQGKKEADKAAEAPKADAPVPAAEAPKMEAPKVEAPAPAVEAPKADAPAEQK